MESQSQTCDIMGAVWSVHLLDAADHEVSALPARERTAIRNVMSKLMSAGPTLPYPHQSAVRGQPGLRELRPRAGRSQWRAFYERFGDGFVIAAIGPEAESNQRGFDQAVSLAERRLKERR